MAPPVEPVRLSGDARVVTIIDQRALPAQLVERELRTIEDVEDAIRTLAVRGAPAIGICAAAGLAMVMQPHCDAPRKTFLVRMDEAAARLATARPTAVNLAWALERCCARAHAAGGDGDALAGVLVHEALELRDEDLAMGAAIGEHALTLLGPAPRVLTHCNAGALATAGAGTALAPVYAAAAQGRDVRVFATETRPLLQGARLTAWELQRAGISVTVLADGAAAALMQAGGVDAVLVGADRIAANGDTANKIGTHALAVAAAYHRVPFHVLAPWSTVDARTPDGAAMPIEMRDRSELASFAGTTVLPDGVAAWTPAFDVTPAALITAIVTDRGVHYPPYNFSA